MENIRGYYIAKTGNLYRVVVGLLEGEGGGERGRRKLCGRTLLRSVRFLNSCELAHHRPQPALGNCREDVWKG